MAEQDNGERINRWEELTTVEELPAASPELLAQLPQGVRRRLGAGALLNVVVTRPVSRTLASCFGEDLGRERMALLSGRVFRLASAEGLLVLVEGAVPVTATHSTQVHVAMSPKSWPDLWSVLEQGKPEISGDSTEATIVGWAHSHPGHGAFFSAEDRRTQEQWFTRPWHIGLVLDPISGALAGFSGPAAKPAVLLVL
jgi:hypothetical protein